MESGLLDSTTGNTNSFQENLKDKMAAIRNPGSDIGIVTRINAPNFEVANRQLVLLRVL